MYKTIIFLLLICTKLISTDFFENSQEICIYAGTSSQWEDLKNELNKYNLKSQKVDKLNKNDERLHVIFDAFYIPKQYFPKNYILFQTVDLNLTPLTSSYLDKMEGAIAIWDPSWENITKYALICKNYAFFSADRVLPLALPLFLEKTGIQDYKELLIYSNSHDTDISSHLPAIFSHSFLKKPKLIIEAGVRSGESSKAFKKTAELLGAKMIGIDIDNCSHVYAELHMKDADFITMNDLDIHHWMKSNNKNETKADIIFIDTSHYYEHTLNELNTFLPILNDKGLLMFHDTNMCPLPLSTYTRLNNTLGIGWNNEKGVVRAIKEFFNISFDETQLTKFEFQALGHKWSILHYPYCNGLTLIQKQSSCM